MTFFLDFSMWHYKLHKLFMNEEWFDEMHDFSFPSSNEHRKSRLKRLNLQVCMSLLEKNDWKNIAWSDLRLEAENIVCKSRKKWLFQANQHIFIKIRFFAHGIYNVKVKYTRNSKLNISLICYQLFQPLNLGLLNKIKFKKQFLLDKQIIKIRNNWILSIWNWW